MADEMLCLELFWTADMNLKGKRREPRNGAQRQAFYDDEFDLVQNNGRVTLPIGGMGVHLTRKQLRTILLLASSLFVAFLIGRK